MNFKTIKGYLFAILSAVIFGCMPLMAKIIYADGVTPFSLVFLRNFFALIPLALLAYKENKSLKIDKKLLPSICLISILGCSLTPILLFCSYQFIASGTATVLHFSYPAIVIIGEIIFLRKKPKAYSIISVLLCLIGISLFYSPSEPLNFNGSALAIGSGLTFATYVILLSRFNSKKVPAFLFCFYTTLISSIACLIICLATNSLVLPSTLSCWALCIVFALLVTVGAVVLFQKSAFLIGGENVSILSTLEPITSILLGVIVFSEPLGVPVIIGSILVVSASIITALFDMKNKKA